MRILLLFSSRFGRTRKVVGTALPLLAVKPDVVEITSQLDPDVLLHYDILLLFTPTYGDEELHDVMEDFLRRIDRPLTGLRFAICELGNYGGYDDFSFGAMRIVRQRLLERNATELGSHLSLDSMPRLDEAQLARWIRDVNQRVGP
jgi:flavodoxin